MGKRMRGSRWYEHREPLGLTGLSDVPVDPYGPSDPAVPVTGPAPQVALRDGSSFLFGSPTLRKR
jgi:hypothetical protein